MLSFSSNAQHLLVSFVICVSVVFWLFGFGVIRCTFVNWGFCTFAGGIYIKMKLVPSIYLFMFIKWCGLGPHCLFIVC